MAPTQEQKSAAIATNGSVSPLVGFFMRVKNKPGSFYEKCQRRLQDEDIYGKEDLAECELEHVLSRLHKVGATAGEIGFLKSAYSLAKSEQGNGSIHFNLISDEENYDTAKKDAYIQKKAKPPSWPRTPGAPVSSVQRHEPAIEEVPVYNLMPPKFQSYGNSWYSSLMDSWFCWMCRALWLSAYVGFLALSFTISIKFGALAIIWSSIYPLSQMQKPLFRSKRRCRANLVQKLMLACGIVLALWVKRSSTTRLTGLQEKLVLKEIQFIAPGAMSGHVMLPKVLDALRPYDLNSGNVLYGQSLCSEEINNEASHITTLMKAHWGNVLPMGDIGGAPYVGKSGFNAGKTGFAALSDHVPDNGHVLVLFGPHIGFSPNGEPGEFLRKWQAAKAMYGTIEKDILAKTNTKFGSGNLVLIGGIQIDMPDPLPGYFQPLHFSIRSANSAPRDLMSTFD